MKTRDAMKRSLLIVVLFAIAVLGAAAPATVGQSTNSQNASFRLHLGIAACLMAFQIPKVEISFLKRP